MARSEGSVKLSDPFGVRQIRKPSARLKEKYQCALLLCSAHLPCSNQACASYLDEGGWTEKDDEQQRVGPSYGARASLHGLVRLMLDEALDRGGMMWRCSGHFPAKKVMKWKIRRRINHGIKVITGRDTD